MSLDDSADCRTGPFRSMAGLVTPFVKGLVAGSHVNGAGLTGQSARRWK